MSQSRRPAERARVVELLPSAAYRLELAGRREVIGHLAAATERGFVRLRLGQEVLVEITAADPGRGRIVKALSKNEGSQR